MQFNNITGKLQINAALEQPPLLLPGIVAGDYNVHMATLSLADGPHKGTVLVEKANHNHILILIPDLLGNYGTNTGYISAYALNFEKRTIAGTVYFPGNVHYGILITKNVK